MTNFETADQAENAFYKAFEDGDLKSMAVIWARSDDAVCVHPHGPHLLGHRQILKSWKEILSNTSGLKISVEVLNQYTNSSISVRFVSETLYSDTGESRAVTVLATNAYRKTESGWQMFLHHASPMPTRFMENLEDSTDEEDADITLH